MSKDQLLSYAETHRLRPMLVVTALPLETQAVRAHVKHIASILGRAGTVYECGHFSGVSDEWLVVVAESGAGTHLAQGIVTNAHIDFKTFEVVIFVGIAGSRKKEAPIGSVVASRAIYYAHSGKYSPEHGFSYRPRTFPVVSRLVSIASKVERDRAWPKRTLPPLHLELPGKDKYPIPFPPSAFVSAIVSVEAVSADPKSELESHIDAHNGDALAIEMEGYGAAYAAYQEETPFIVVRGISDNRGDKTPEADAINQPVAAAHAAAFAFEFLSMWGNFYPLDPVSIPPAGADEVSSNDSEQHPPPSPSTDIPSHSIFVLAFEGEPEDFPPERVEAILTKLRDLTGNQGISLVRTEEGSFRIGIKAKPLDRKTLEETNTSSALLRESSARLIGVFDEHEYEISKISADSLTRASLPLLGWQQTLPDGTHLIRPEHGQILTAIGAIDCSTTALLGPPGSGKSALLASLGKTLLERGIPTLAIKADLLDPSIVPESELHSSLALPELPSSLLLNASRFGPAVLLIDQLDALAGYVDLSTGRLSALLNLVRKLGDRKNIHVLLSSRTFEFEHDTRLKSVRATSVTLTLPPWSAVLTVLEGIGIQAAGWPADAQDLLRSPQALSTYLRLAEKGGDAPFRTYQSMLDQLWHEQILNKPDGPGLAKLATSIAERMAERETLWLPAASLVEQADNIRSLIASGFLIGYDAAGSRVGFSHQTVFEHALARAFTRGEGRLSTYILERQSSLFVRPKLWAALTYLRDVDPKAYDSELANLWSTPNLRLHLRHMLIEFLGHQKSPTPFELTHFEEALTSDQRRIALLSMPGSPGWLKLLGASHISRAMLSEDECGIAYAILNSAWTTSFDAVIALVRRNWLPNPQFDRYTWNLLQSCPTWTEQVTQIAQEIVARGGIDPHSFDYLISTMGVDHPEAALKLVSLKLQAQLEGVLKASGSRDKEPPSGTTAEELMIWTHKRSRQEPLTEVVEQRDGWEALDALAKARPALFLSEVWPWFQAVLAALRLVKSDADERPGFPLPWTLNHSLHDGEHFGEDQSPILSGIATALSELAQIDEPAFLTWLSNHEHEDAAPAQRLFANALAANPERYAERAAQFLLDNKNRFHLGSIGDFSGTTTRLVQVAGPYWLPSTRDRFVQAVLSYNPQKPARATGRNWLHFNNAIRQLKLDLLLAVDQKLLSTQARRFIAEQLRRFPNVRRGVNFHGGWIGSPISAESLTRASDEQLVNAFRKVPDSAEWDHPTQWMKGGNVQLSREFAELAKVNPERAVRVIKKFEPSFGSRAAGYALDAMAEGAPPSIVIALIEDLHRRGFTAGEFRRSAASAIQRLVKRDISIDDSILNILKAWLAQPEVQESAEISDESSDVSDDDSSESKDATKTPRARASVLWGHGGFSILPHGNFPIIDAISQILLDRKDPDGLVALYTRHLESPEDPSVWRALLRYVRFIHPTDDSLLLAFLSRLFERYPEIAITQDAIHTLAYIHRRFPDFVIRTISAWRMSESAVLKQAYGELIALVALIQPNFDQAQFLLKELQTAEEMTDARVGAAYAAVNIWPEIQSKEQVSKLLTQLLRTPEPGIWAAAFDLFRLVDELTPTPEWIAVLEAISENLGQIRGLESTFVVERLQTLLPHKASLIAKLAKGLIEGWRDELTDIRMSTASSAGELVDLAITLHRLGPDTREAGIDLFEDLLEVNAYTARETLGEIDNRFREAPRTPRRRLPRRARRARSQ